MAGHLPRISIITSSFNQGEFIGRTIDSVVAQNYPGVEHIVIDGMSTDDTPAVLARYPHLKVVREPDRGQADAINKGFKLATGDILCFLNSDDTFEPGALHAVASEIDPAAGRHVVFGRCRFIDETDRFLGVEHPSGFTSHRRVLEIWKGHLLPQPAVFWTREVWDTCGPLNVDERLMLDYDLFCRFSRRYRFWPLDRIVANYRLHNLSKTNSITDTERLEQAITISRRYWGTILSPQYWQILASYGAFRLDRRARAVKLMRGGRSLYRQGWRVQGLTQAVRGAALAPDVVLDVLVTPALKPLLIKAWMSSRSRKPGRDIHPQTRAWFGLTTLYPDGWAGPQVAADVVVPPGATAIGLDAATLRAGLRGQLEIEAFLDGLSLGRRAAGKGELFSVAWPLTGISAGSHALRLVASTFLVAHDSFGNQDYRPLSYRPSRLWFDGPAGVTDISLRGLAASEPVESTHGNSPATDR